LTYSTLKPSTKPMARTPMKRGTKRMKSRGPKMTPIRKSARDQECTIRLPGVCNFDTSTTVLCHSNESTDGKGMGLKASDECAAYGCSACHDVVDGRRPRPEGMSLELMLSIFREAIAQTRRILKRKGLLETAE
jgi:hypothetical protein